MDSHKAAPMSPRERAWTEYLRWTQGAIGTPDYEEIERRAWARLQLSLMPKVAGPEADDALDALAALDEGSDPNTKATGSP
jgi:hypothetical protein